MVYYENMTKNIDWSIIDDKILAMSREGKSAYAISKEVGFERETVAKHMEQDLGLTTTRRGPRPVVAWVSEDTIRCSVCGRVKHTDSYRRRKAAKTRLGVQFSSVCKDCQADRRREEYKDQPMSWRKKLYDIQKSAERRGLVFDITEKFLVSVYETQGHLCAYTDTYLPFTTGTQSKSGPRSTSLSVDRFDTDMGYVVGNVLLCSSRANSIKSNQTLVEFKKWMPTWYDRGREVLERIDISLKDK